LLRNGAFDQVDKSPETLSAFLQEWLFFYFLKKTIGLTAEIEWSDFQIIEPKTRNPLVSTSKLHAYLKMFNDTLSRDALQSRTRSDIGECLESASLYTTSLMDKNREQLPGLCLPQEVILSIMVLHQTVYETVYRRASLKDTGFRMYGAHRDKVGIVIPVWLKEQLLRAGYCHYDIAKLAETEDVSTILYVALLPLFLKNVMGGGH
jgi:hypothetical protein